MECLRQICILITGIENISEMFGYINTGRVSIRIHRDITGEMWFGVGWSRYTSAFPNSAIMNQVAPLPSRNTFNNL